MQQSFTFYLVTFFIKMSGLKKAFNSDPIDYKVLRKQDIFNPKGNFYSKNISQKFKVLETVITEVTVDDVKNKLILFIHGGAFVSGPCQHHWDSIQKIAKQTKACIWLCNYPKAPEHNIIEINDNIDAVYNLALKTYKSQDIILLGDSAGGSLILTLTQRLIQQGKPIPKKIIAISPVVDASFSNPKIDLVDAKDVLLSKKGVLSAKKMTLGHTNLNEKTISPINGSFIGFPELYLFLAENDITFPDQELLVNKLKLEKINVNVIIGENMPHIWPLLPVIYESKMALNNIIEIINTN